MNLELWRNIAVVWLSLYAFILLLIPLALSYLLVRGINWVHRKLPPLFLKAQGYSQIMRSQSEQIADKIAAPLITGHSGAAQVGTTLDRLFTRKELPSTAESASRRTTTSVR